MLGQFTLTPAAGTSDLTGFTYQLDGAAATTVAATAATTVTLSIATDGTHTLVVRAKDRAGNESDPLTYTFKVGRAGLSQPVAGGTVVDRMKIAVDAEQYFTRARLQYRRGPGAAELDIPLTNLRTASGGAVTQNPARLSDLGANAIWNAADTLGTVGGVVQVRAAMQPDTDLETRLSMYRTNGTGGFIGADYRIGLDCNDATIVSWRPASASWCPALECTTQPATRPAWGDRKVDVAASTLKEYKRLLRSRVVPRLGDRRLADITEDDIAAFVAWLTKDLMPAGVRKVHVVLHQVLQAAVPRHIPTNPAVSPAPSTPCLRRAVRGQAEPRRRRDRSSMTSDSRPSANWSMP